MADVCEITGTSLDIAGDVWANMTLIAERSNGASVDGASNEVSIGEPYTIATNASGVMGTYSGGAFTSGFALVQGWNYFVTPYTQGGRTLKPFRLAVPDGTTAAGIDSLIVNDPVGSETAAALAVATVATFEDRVEALEAAPATGAEYTAGGPVACATTANITLSGEQTLDGVTTSASRVLVKDQTDAAENGIYVSAAGAWSRATDMDAAGEVASTSVYVSAGTLNGGKSFATYSVVTTLGTDAIAFTETADNSAVQDQIDAKADQSFVDWQTAAGLTPVDDDAPVVPIVWGADGTILFGYDTTTRAVVGGNADCLPTVREQTRALRYPPKFAGYSHVMYFGQSLAAGVASGSPITTTQPYSNVTFDGGTREFTSFSSFIPLVEDTVETGVATACNKAVSMHIENGGEAADMVLVGSSAAQGSKTIAQLEKEGTEDWYKDQFIVQLEAAKALDSDYSLVAVPWFQGESDVIIPTSEAAYKADMQALIASINFDANTKNKGNGPVHMLTYQTLVRSRQETGIVEAQRNAAIENDLIHTVIPIYHIEHATDDTHLTAGGYRHVGAYFGRAVYEMKQGLVPQSLRPISATRRGTEIRVRMNVPTGPMVLDATNLYSTTDSGFAVEDATGVLTISTIAIDGDDVVITTSTTPSGATEVRYALDYISGSVPTDYPASAATGNLRDSTPGAIDVSGSAKPLWYPSLHFKLSVTELSE